MYNFYEYKNVKWSVDTAWNGAYGIFLTLWASLFVESWKKKQARMIFEWDLENNSDVLINDERKGKFKFLYKYNEETNEKLKHHLGKSCWVTFFNVVYSIVLLGLVIGIMFYFESKTYDEVIVGDPEAVAN